MHTLPFKFITIKKLAEKKKKGAKCFFFLRDVDELTAKFADLFLSTLLYIYILYSPIFFPAPTFSLFSYYVYALANEILCGFCFMHYLLKERFLYSWSVFAF